ncbi:MAG: hypothetical protein O2907_07460, partial [Proteobacteria bacterium]|nr:hypothetical protein [Pseudomonadota bacterium]
MSIKPADESITQAVEEGTVSAGAAKDAPPTLRQFFESHPPSVSTEIVAVWTTKIRQYGGGRDFLVPLPEISLYCEHVNCGGRGYIGALTNCISLKSGSRATSSTIAPTVTRSGRLFQWRSMLFRISRAKFMAI